MNLFFQSGEAFLESFFKPELLKVRAVSKVVQHLIFSDRARRAGLSNDEINQKLKSLDDEEIVSLNHLSLEPKECPNCPNEFHPNLLEETRLDGNEVISCQGCRSKLWLAVDDEHYGTIVMIHKPERRS